MITQKKGKNLILSFCLFFVSIYQYATWLFGVLLQQTLQSHASWALYQNGFILQTVQLQAGF